MYFRFAAAVLLVVAVSVAGVAIEKSTLGFRHEISRQEYRRQLLREEQQKLRLETQQLGAPASLIDAAGDEKLNRATQQSSTPREPVRRRRPLLRWQRPTNE